MKKLKREQRPKTKSLLRKRKEVQTTHDEDESTVFSGEQKTQEEIENDKR
jgi:hypothetical protein